MHKIFAFSILILSLGCTRKSVAHPPAGRFPTEKDLITSKNRTKALNELERAQIQDWINHQDDKFYAMPLNYWINVPDLAKNQRRADGSAITYEYDIYDFDMVRLSEATIKKENVSFSHFEELDAVEDALRYLPDHAVVTLLVPSALAFGTYGDGGAISNDMPLIIKLRVH